MRSVHRSTQQVVMSLQVLPSIPILVGPRDGGKGKSPSGQHGRHCVLVYAQSGRRPMA